MKTAPNKSGGADGELRVFVSCFSMLMSPVIPAAAHLDRSAFGLAAGPLGFPGANI